MKLEQQVTSLEVSKKLKELGVKQESLYLWSDHTLPATLWLEGNYDAKYSERPNHPCYSAFTVAELGEMLPGNDGIYYFVTRKGLLGNLWYCSSFGMLDESLEFRTEGRTEADARGLMLIRLLENGLITLK